MTTELRQKQIEQAEELLFSGPQETGFAKELFFGRFQADAIMPYPVLSAEAQKRGDEAVARVREFTQNHLDADKVDRDADISPEIIKGLGEIGVMGMAIAEEHGGRGLSQQNYCRVMEVIGGHCGSTAVFVNAHHSIGLRALELFGTPEQKARWLPSGASGEDLAAFALTEVEAGSDASNVQTKATPSPDGKGYILNGGKRYITNGGIAKILTVMARTPDEKVPEGKVTAFLVTPDMEGFKVLEERMDKVGIRGTATGRLEFKDMYVPKENILGEVGKGLRLALTVLDFGRTTFGASCTGAAKYCVEQMIKYSKERKQFGQTLSEFELIRSLIAQAAADTFAMESATYHTAALIDSGEEDYMLETSMLKVFSSDALWRIVNDCLQIHGGAGFFTDRPFERMMRDARLNLIGEGANEVLRCFNCMVGMRNLGKQLEGVVKKPWEVWKMVRTSPPIPEPKSAESAISSQLKSAATRLSKQIGRFSWACQKSLVQYRESILDRQCVQARLGDIATELFVSSCVYSRMCGLIDSPNTDRESVARDIQTGLFYMQCAARRNDSRFEALKDNDDSKEQALAKTLLGS